MNKYIFLSITLTALAVSSSFSTKVKANAALCEYQIYTPTSVYPHVYNTFIEMGIMPVQANLFNPNRSDLALVRSNQLLGYIDFHSDQRRGQSGIQFYDSAGNLIATHVELIYPCPIRNPVTRCHDTRLSTELDHSIYDEDAPFRILDGDRGVEYYRYGRQRNINLWRNDFDEALDWIFNVYETQAAPVLFTIADPFAAFQFAVLHHPDVIWLGEMIKIHRTSERVVVTGVVPSNYIYDKIVSIAMGLGLYQIDMRVTIDGRLRRPIPIYPLWQDCI